MELKESIEAIFKYSQGLNENLELNIESLLEKWKKSKEKFFKMFGNQYIYEYPEEVQFTLSDSAKQARFEEFASTIRNVYGNDRLFHFLETVNQDFYLNKLSSDYFLNSRGDKIKKGTKIIKAFKYFEEDAGTLRLLQDAASTLIQENKVKGKLCLSVHPLDFLSISENTYHWHSCHNLQGDYRAGNLSYMTDEVTFICYLKGEENVKLPSFPPEVKWNSKKWRTLLFLHPQNLYIFAGRQYPFSCMTGLDLVLSVLRKDILEAFCFRNWENDWFREVNGKKLHTKNIVIDGEVFPDTELILNNKNSMAYNDLLNSTVYLNPYISRSHNYWVWRHTEGDTSITIGDEVKCIHCGESLVEHSNSLMCPECDLKHGTEFNDTIGKCTHCGRRIIINDAYDVGGYDYLCQDCYESSCFICDACGCIEYNDFKHWDKDEQEFLCQACYDERTYEEDFEEEEE